jgi:hypothetical protein
MIKKFSWLLISSFLCFTFSHGAEKNTAIYVATNGNDSWSGILPAPNGTMSDGPVAHLERALTIAAGRMRTQGDQITILMRGGTYRSPQPIVLDSRMNGEPNAPLVISSYEKENVRICGSLPITHWAPISDTSLLQRLSPAAQGHVLIADLKENGIDSIPPFTQRGSPPLELFLRGERLPMARFPNEGWLLVADVPQNGDSLFNEGLSRERRFDNVPVGRHYGRINYSEAQPSRWSPDNEIYALGYWTWDWSDSYQRVQAILPSKNEILFATPHHHYGYTRNQRYRFVNVLEELDHPGEWVLDRRKGRVFAWLPGDPRNAEVTASVNSQPLVVFAGVANVLFRRITLEQTRGVGVLMKKCDNVTVAGCELRLLGGDAVVIDGGTASGVHSCDIHDVALGGVKLGGGDRLTLAPGKNFVINNHIHHYSTWVKTGQYAVVLSGVANYIGHNLMHDAPHEAIALSGNEHCVEFNDVHDVCRETGDAGALHTGRDWTWRGNVIRYNYWHDLKGPGLHGVMGVYLDDWASGFTVYGNLFYRSGRSAMIGGGRDNTIENNIFLECTPSVHVDARGLGWASYYFESSDYLVSQMKAVNYDKPPYSTRYPYLPGLYADQPALPKYNRIAHNVSAGGRWLDVHDYPAFDLSIVAFENNLIADTALFRHRNKDEKGWDPYYLNIDWQQGFTTHRTPDSTVTKQFPHDRFVSPKSQIVLLKNGRPALPAGSPAYRMGFRRIPAEKIGLYIDEYRTSVKK